MLPRHAITQHPSMKQGLMNLWTRRAALLSSSLTHWFSPVPSHSSLIPWWLSDLEVKLLRDIIAQKQEEQTADEYPRILASRPALFKPIIRAIDDAEIILIGEATHGTEEFYRLRADLTKALLLDDNNDFDAIVCEGDFPIFGDLNQYVGGGAVPECHSPRRCPDTIQDAMDSFRDRFPVWMWKNDAFANFVTWLKDFNNHQRIVVANTTFPPVQLLGMDIYSIYRSIDEVVAYVEDTANATGTWVVPDVRDRYAILNRFRPEATDYGKAVFYNTISSQAKNVQYVWNELHKTTTTQWNASPELWAAVENARMVVAGEAFFRQLLISRQRHEDGTLWNLREAAMFQSLQNVREYLQREKRKRFDGMLDRPPRIIVWAHNSHVGDGRATQHGKKRSGTLPHMNLGQLCKQVFGNDKVYSIGFTCNTGTVRAVREWGEPDTIMSLLPAMEGSHEYLLGRIASATGQNVAGYCFRSLSLDDLPCSQQQPQQNLVVDESARALFALPRIQRFVGVSYAPETEIQSHYSTSILSDEFDYIIHVDRSNAVQVKKVQAKSKYRADAEVTRMNDPVPPPMYLLDAFGTE
jgi:erythromycin esterase-like protein